MGFIPLELKLPSTAWGGQPARGKQAVDASLLGMNGWIKRAMDIIIVVPALIFLLPIFVFVAIAIKREGGPLFYTQTRIGRDGKPFKMLKFRTMRVDAESALAAHLESCPAAREEWGEFQKLRDDPRITRAGKFLRLSSIDELPQLWNILRGDMSIVGQRPILYSQRDAYGLHIDGYERTRPGLTGLWQVSGRNALSFEQRAQLGSEYVNRWSLWFDMKLILLTVPAVLLSKDAY